MGRPGLPLMDQGHIFGVLSIHPRRSKEFQALRRELAQRFDRTERSIDQIYDRRLECLLTHLEKERGPVSKVRPAHL